MTPDRKQIHGAAGGNEARARTLVAAAVRQGVHTWCVAPGGRNAPLVAVLATTPGIELISHFEERSAGFFALGRSRRDRAPVAVVTTSGTAAAELLPSAVEAHYSGTAVLFVTADRPHAMRGTGAPQAIEQRDLLVPYAPMELDSDAVDEIGDPEVLRWGPTHWNVAFDEPLFGPPIPVEVDLAAVSGGVEPSPPDGVRPEQSPSPSDGALAAFGAVLDRSPKPLVLVGPLDPEDADSVAEFLVRLNAPVYAEGTSGLRTDGRLGPLLLVGGDRSLNEVARLADSIVRLGDVPTARLWRDVGALGWPTPVASFGRRPFAGRDGGPHASGPAFAARLAELGVPETRWDLESVFERDRAWASRIDELLVAHPTCEAAMVRQFSERASGLVYLGNSLPVREWDAFAVRNDSISRIAASRGANGIDGQLSTFLGLCRPGEESWALVGDLTALYDLAAPWLLDRTELGPVRIVVINNGGGRIFDRVFPEHSAGGAFRNAHGISFEGWAAMWSLPHLSLTEFPQDMPLPDRVVVELKPDEVATAAFWEALAKVEPRSGDVSGGSR